MTMHELRPVPPQRVELAVSGERSLNEDRAMNQQRELGAVLTDMWENGEKLVRQEIDLGLAELQVRADKLKASLLEGAMMGAIYNAGAMVLLAAVVLGLSEVMAPWLAALLVAIAALGTGYVLQNRAKHNAIQAVADTDNPRTQQTVEAMKEGLP
jgi:VIT1/CCC1 family predicted Fe2+/Mn2+ transporter